MEEENAKPTHGLPPTFWSQLRLEKLEEARFPVKLVIRPLASRFLFLTAAVIFTCVAFARNGVRPDRVVRPGFCI